MLQAITLLPAISRDAARTVCQVEGGGLQTICLLLILVDTKYSLSGKRQGFTDKLFKIQLCPVEVGFTRTNHTAVATLLLSHLHGQ